MPLHDLISALRLAIHLTCLVHLSRASSAKWNRISSRFFAKTFGAFFTKNERTKGPRGNTQIEAEMLHRAMQTRKSENWMKQKRARAHTHTHTHTLLTSCGLLNISVHDCVFCICTRVCTRACICIRSEEHLRTSQMGKILWQYHCPWKHRNQSPMDEPT